VHDLPCEFVRLLTLQLTLQCDLNRTRYDSLCYYFLMLVDNTIVYRVKAMLSQRQRISLKERIISQHNMYIKRTFERTRSRFVRNCAHLFEKNKIAKVVSHNDPHNTHSKVQATIPLHRHVLVLVRLVFAPSLLRFLRRVASLERTRVLSLFVSIASPQNAYLRVRHRSSSIHLRHYGSKYRRSNELNRSTRASVR
jgi:hypothetical protein